MTVRIGDIIQFKKQEDQQRNIFPPSISIMIYAYNTQLSIATTASIPPDKTCMMHFPLGMYMLNLTSLSEP